MTNTKSQDRKVSLTFQARMTLKEGVGKIAKALGYTRMDGQVEKPELTPAIVLLLEYAVAHEVDMRKWLADGKPEVVLHDIKPVETKAVKVSTK